MRRVVLAGAALMCVLAMSDGASAQSRRNSAAPRTGTADSEDLPPSVPPPVPTLPPSRGISGPRLQTGAVLCRDEDALRHRVQVNQRQIEGVPDAGNPMEGCHPIRQESGVEIVARHGFGRTQVKVKPNGEIGWTDAYLP